MDDDALMRRSLSFNLGQNGVRVNTAANAEDALALARRDTPDIVLLDIGPPGMDGLDTLRIFKDQLGVPVIFLTARRRELDEVLGLELGADDYITKPFNLDVVVAHIKAVSRQLQSARSPQAEIAPVTVDDLTIDPADHTATIGGHPIELTPREFDLLYTLALNAGRVVSTSDLLAQVWGAEFVGEPQVVYIHIR